MIYRLLALAWVFVGVAAITSHAVSLNMYMSGWAVLMVFFVYKALTEI